MNLFVIQSMAPDVSIHESCCCVRLFVASDLIRVVVLLLFPGITCLCPGSS